MNRSTWVIIIVSCIVIIGLIYIFNRGVPDTSSPQMPPMVPGDPNQSHWIGYNTWVIVDPQTHCDARDRLSERRDLLMSTPRWGQNKPK